MKKKYHLKMQMNTTLRMIYKILPSIPKLMKMRKNHHNKHSKGIIFVSLKEMVRDAGNVDAH